MAHSCLLLRSRLANDLLERRYSFENLQPPVHAEREHAVFNGAVANLHGADVLQDQPAQLGTHRHHFVETLPPFEARAGAGVASLTPEERQLADAGVERESLEVWERLGGRLRARVIQRLLREPQAS